MIEPNAPPVMMIGPSAPNGPPEPIEIADEIGLSSATLGSIRLPRIRIASSASGMPWPRIRLRAVARHQADDQAADDRHQHRRGRPACGRPAYRPRATAAG